MNKIVLVLAVFVVLLCAAIGLFIGLKQVDVLDKDGMTYECHYLKPQSMPIDVTKGLEDGIYFVSFDSKDSSDQLKGKTFEMEIFTPDIYDAVDLHLVQKGDSMKADGKDFVIASIERNDSSEVIKVNGGYDKGGYDFIPIGGGAYRINISDDHTTYTSWGKKQMEIPSDVKITDTGSFDYNQYNTTVRIENGKIVELTRLYIP